MIKKDFKIILVSNIGSASRKYIVYKITDKSNIQELFKIQFDQKEFYPKVRLEDALLEFFRIAKKEYNFSISMLDIIAERVVAAGEFFLKDRIIDEEYIDMLKQARQYDVLHTESLIHELEQLLTVREVCDKNKIKCKFKIVGVSDSSFHSTISREVYTYPIKDYKPHHFFRRFGYHGISMSGIVNELKDHKNMIAIHLGGGGSVTAIKNKKSIFNSFGMTPVSGLVNLTRVGDIDPFVVLSVYKKNKRTFSFLDEGDKAFENTKKEIYEESGLFALTGERDMRDILANLEVKDKKTRETNEFAIDLYLTKINEYIGMALSHLGEVDTIVLTGSILEKSELFRERLYKKISWLKLKDSQIIIMKTEEEKEMARLVLQGKFI